MQCIHSAEGTISSRNKFINSPFRLRQQGGMSSLLKKTNLPEKRQPTSHTIPEFHGKMVKCVLESTQCETSSLALNSLYSGIKGPNRAESRALISPAHTPLIRSCSLHNPKELRVQQERGTHLYFMREPRFHWSESVVQKCSIEAAQEKPP